MTKLKMDFIKLSCFDISCVLIVRAKSVNTCMSSYCHVTPQMYKLDAEQCPKLDLFL